MKQRTRQWIFAGASIILAAYLVTALVLAHNHASERLCNGIYIHVIDTARQKFVTAEELRHELGSLPMMARSLPAATINIDSLQRVLRVIDKIESVSVRRLTDGSIRIEVEPMRPVARIFEPTKSYYINKDGKSISAEARYHVDVPVIAGVFTDTALRPVGLLPLLDYVRTDSRWSQLTSMIKVDSPRDVLIIPAIRGLVFNLGTPDKLDSKFRRLNMALSQILPAKGWSFYDTVSVKWDGQIVATRRHKERPDTTMMSEDIPDDDDVATMSVGSNVAAGQAIPGRKANSEKPIPASRAMQTKRDSSDTNKKLNKR